MTSGIQQDVFRFQITVTAFRQPSAAKCQVTGWHCLHLPVDDIIFVQMLKSEHQLGNVEPRTRLGKPAFLLQVPEQLSTALVIRHKEQVVLGLETEFQSDQEWRVEGLLQDLSLSDGMGNLLLGDDILFGQHLHRVDSLRVPFSHLEDLAEGSTSDQLENLEVFRGQVNLALQR